MNDGKSKSLGWVHNTSYQWFNQYSSNSCIQQCVDNNNGIHVDPADFTQYNEDYNEDENNATGHFSSYSPFTIRLGGLKASAPFFPKTYRFDWYSTEGNGQYITSNTATTNIFGVLEINVPSFSSYGDVAFKLYLFSAINEPVQSFVPAFENEDDDLYNEVKVINKDSIGLSNVYDCISFPNPANQLLEIKCTSNIKNVTLISALGNIVFKSSVNSINFKMDTQTLANGIYVLKIENSMSEIFYEKIIIQH